MSSSAASMATTDDVSKFQRQILNYCNLYGKVSADPDHCKRMNVSRTNLDRSIQSLRKKRMLEIDTSSSECVLTQRGKDLL